MKLNEHTRIVAVIILQKKCEVPDSDYLIPPKNNPFKVFAIWISGYDNIYKKNIISGHVEADILISSSHITASQPTFEAYNDMIANLTVSFTL